jgi:REP element-mobilizing transposase RayT
MASTFSNLLYHVVFSTKRREPLIRPNLQKDLYAYLGGIIRGERGTMLAIGGMSDHVHIVMRLRPDHSLADMVKTFKAKSSKWVNQQRRIPGRFSWQTGYGAFTVSKSQLPKVLQYVKNQQQHHRGRSFKEELIELLRKHEIEYDERYLLD